MTKKKPRKSAAPSSEESSKSPEERLQKVLAAAGLGSRRQCEELILEGRVEIDGQVAQQLGVKVDPLQQEIRVDGTRLPRPTRKYYVVNKPVGVVCTNRDPAGRMRLIDLLPTDERLFSVGRLDRSSEGMILLTNDGEFANRLAHPRYGVEKTYRVVVAGRPEPETLQQLVKGVHLAEGVARAVSVRLKKKHKDSAELEVVLNEGKNREIRRVLARIGHKVLRLKRIAIGSVKLADLPVGQSRRLTQQEVRALLAETERKASRPTARPAGPRRRDSSSERPKSRTSSRSRSTETPSPRTGSVLTFDSETDAASAVSTSRKAASRKAASRKGGPSKGEKGSVGRKTRASKSNLPPAKTGKKSAGQGGRARRGSEGGDGAASTAKRGKGTHVGKGSVGKGSVGKGKRKGTHGGSTAQGSGFRKSSGRKAGKRATGRGRG